MRGDEFLDKMELVEADLVEAADRQLSSTAGSNHRKGGAYMARKIAALAAVIALMICSGAVGAIAFSSETIVEVPAEQETIELEAIGLTLILPDSWEGNRSSAPVSSTCSSRAGISSQRGRGSTSASCCRAVRQGSSRSS